MSALQLTLDMSQRWLFRKPKYRPSRETIRPADYDVAEIPDDTTARNFIREHHYSGSMGAARVRVGLYRHGALVGVAVFSHPCSDAVLTRTFPVPPARAVELGRFVLLDEVEANAESHFLGRAFDVLRSRGLLGVVTFSDPVPRRSVAGDLILPGHCGIAFQAHNGIYLGRGTPRTLRLLPNGRVLHERTMQKIRAGERGWRSGAAQLEEFGAPAAPDDPDERRVWLTENIRQLTRPVRHRGNHKVRVAANRCYAASTTSESSVSEAARCTCALRRRHLDMRFWFMFAAMMGPKFFRRFIVLFALGMMLMFYSLIRS